MVNPILMVVHQRPGKRPLGPFLKHHVKLFRRQFLPPLILRLRHLLNTSHRKYPLPIRCKPPSPRIFSKTKQKRLTG